MSDPVPYVAVGNDELGGPVGDTVQCLHCGKQHPVKYGESILPDGTREPSRMLSFYECRGKTYLHGIDGRVWK